LGNIVQLSKRRRRKTSLKFKYKRVEKILSDFKNLTYILQYETIHNYSSRSTVYQMMLNLASKMRLSLYYELANDSELADILMDEIDRKKDFHAWVNIFGWTHNPIQTANPKTPFILYPFHIDFYNDMRRYSHTIIIKARGMGYTWVKVFIKVFRLLYDDDYKGMVASRVEGDVDVTGDVTQSIFGRCRSVLMNLPYFNDLDTELDVNKYLFIRVGNNTLTGYNSSPDGPRSTRGTEFDIEEAGVVEDFKGLLTAVVSVANEIRIGGTVKGTANGFYDYWENKENAYHHIFWGHELHPIFSTEDWVRREKLKYDDEQAFEQEIMGNFFAMVGNKILMYLRESHLEDLRHLNTDNLVKFVAIDPAGGSSAMSIWYCLYDINSGDIYYMAYSEIRNAIYDTAVKDIEAHGYLNSIYLIDSASRNVAPDGKGWAEELSNLLGNKNFYLVDNKDIRGSVVVANRNLRDGKIHFNKYGQGVKLGFKRLYSYVYVDSYGSNKVKKDKSSDGGDSFRYSMAIEFLFPNENNRKNNKMMRGYNFTNRKKASSEGYNPLVLYRKQKKEVQFVS